MAMKGKDVGVVVVTALLVMAAAVGVFDAMPAVNAVDDKKVAVPQPALEVDGVRFTLTLDKESVKPGKKPVATLRAENCRDEAVEASVNVRMMVTAPASQFSRSMSLPVSMWNGLQPVTLKPRETRTYRLSITKATPKAGWMTFQLVSGKKVVVVASTGNLLFVPASSPNGATNFFTANVQRQIADVSQVVQVVQR
jgi:hypothetical protein